MAKTIAIIGAGGSMGKWFSEYFVKKGFEVTGFEETKLRLENGNWEFCCSNVPDAQIRQIFLVDPNGAKLELNFKF